MEQVTSITMWLPALFVVMMRFRVSGLYGAEHGPSTIRMDAGTEAARIKDTSAQRVKGFDRSKMGACTRLAVARVAALDG